MFSWSFEVKHPIFGCKIYNPVWPRLGFLIYAAAALPADNEVMLDNFEKPNIFEILTQLSLYINVLD